MTSLIIRKLPGVTAHNPNPNLKISPPKFSQILEGLKNMSISGGGGDGLVPYTMITNCFEQPRGHPPTPFDG